MRYRKKPVEVEAMQLEDDLRNHSAVANWINSQGGEAELPFAEPCVFIVTLEGRMRADIGDYVIRGVQGEFYPCKPDIFEATYEAADPAAGEDGDSNLVAHARHELELIGEDRDVIDWYVRVVKAFASFGHSGGSAMATIPVLHDLLQYRPLTDLTDDPDEWIDQSDVSGGHPLWQNRRQSEAFSGDGGRSYYLLSELEAAGSADTTPLHTSAEHRGHEPVVDS